MRVVVAGGGVSGLVAARELALAGHDVTVWEAGDRLGGMVAGVELAGVVVDSGAEAYATRTDDVARLCRELGLDVAGPAGRSHVWWPDRGKFPLATGVLGIPGDVDDPALDVLTSEERCRLAADLTDPVTDLGTSVAEVVTARLGAAALRRLVEPLARGVYRMDPADMPLERFAPGLLGDVQRHGSLLRAVAARSAGGTAVAQPVGGMHRLVDALAADLERLGAEVRLSAPLGSLAEASADMVVLATPAAVTAGLLAERGVAFERPGIGVARSLLLALDHPGLAADPVGSGLLLGERPDDMQAQALTHYSAKWPWARELGAEVIRVSLPPEGRVDLDAMLSDCSRLTGLALDRSHVVDLHEAVWGQVPRVLQGPARAELGTALAGLADVRVTGAWLAGNGLAAVVRDAREAGA